MQAVHEKLREIRERERVTPRAMATRLGMFTQEYMRLETCPRLAISNLLECQQALNVPLCEFFDLQHPVPQRAQLLRVYKTAAAIRELSLSHEMQVLIDRLMEDLEILDPELSRNVKRWQTHKRTGDEASMRELNMIADTRDRPGGPSDFDGQYSK